MFECHEEKYFYFSFGYFTFAFKKRLSLHFFSRFSALQLYVLMVELNSVRPLKKKQEILAKGKPAHGSQCERLSFVASQNLEDFMALLDLHDDNLRANATSILKQEGVAVKQLIESVVTDEDLEEVGISTEARAAIATLVAKVKPNRNLARTAGPTDRIGVPQLAVAEPFPVGTRVSGLYKNGKRYPATVAEIREGGEYLLNWDDGDQMDRLKRAEHLSLLAAAATAQPEPIPVDTAAPVHFSVGMRVSGLYRNGNRYPATIAEVRENGEYLLNWDDGDPADRVKVAEHLLPL